MIGILQTLFIILKTSVYKKLQQFVIDSDDEISDSPYNTSIAWFWILPVLWDI